MIWSYYLLFKVYVGELEIWLKLTPYMGLILMKFHDAAAVDACDSRKLNFNGNYNCSESGGMYSCSLSCPVGMDFQTTPAAVYTCLFSEGRFNPPTVPQCVFSEYLFVFSKVLDAH